MLKLAGDKMFSSLISNFCFQLHQLVHQKKKNSLLFLDFLSQSCQLLQGYFWLAHRFHTWSHLRFSYLNIIILYFRSLVNEPSKSPWSLWKQTTRTIWEMATKGRPSNLFFRFISSLSSISHFIKSKQHKLVITLNLKYKQPSTWMT